MYLVMLSNGEYLSLNGEALSFHYKSAANAIAADCNGNVVDKRDLNYYI